MNILVACEESQEVCKAFRAKGHRAFSCDILSCSGGHDEWHIKNDVSPLLNGDCLFETSDGQLHYVDTWDMVIAFPPCTDLAASGARWFKEKRENGIQQMSINFFMQFANLKCKRVAIENPVGIMSNIYRKPDQIIQPWMFGHGEQKATCLWLKGLKPLEPTNVVNGREQRIWKMAPSPERSKMRSKTFSGIAQAMADQWGIDNE